jgi:hypothetical protein
VPVAERNGLGPPRAGLGLGGQTTMTEPARRNADGPPADDPERKPDPRAGGWADVRHALVADSHLVAQAAAGVAARPGDSAALAVLTLALDILGDLRAIASRCQVGEAILEAERERGFAAGYDACKAERGCLRAV